MQYIAHYTVLVAQLVTLNFLLAAQLNGKKKGDPEKEFIEQMCGNQIHPGLSYHHCRFGLLTILNTEGKLIHFAIERKYGNIRQWSNTFHAYSNSFTEWLPKIGPFLERQKWHLKCPTCQSDAVAEIHWWGFAFRNGSLAPLSMTLTGLFTVNCLSHVLVNLNP